MKKKEKDSPLKLYGDGTGIQTGDGRWEQDKEMTTPKI